MKDVLELALEALKNSKPIDANSVIPHNNHCKAIAALEQAIKQRGEPIVWMQSNHPVGMNKNQQFVLFTKPYLPLALNREERN